MQRVAVDAASCRTKWWSFQPPAKHHDSRSPSSRIGSKSPIDRFILAALEKKGLYPAAQADKRTLIRRATFDLTGLPPTPQEIKAFLDDDSTEAFARVVDRLLASSAYGERWGRHWLDVVRYADTAGDGADYPVREAYKYRNYVIDAFNQDTPYDVFLREQIAGDILAAQGPPELYARRMTATGFIAIGKRFGYNTNDQFRHLDIADTLDVLGKSVLGLSIGCARCHDHKYDPISSADYYALYGIFASSAYTFPGGEEHKMPEGLVPLVPPDEQKRLDADRLPKLAAVTTQMTAAMNERSRMQPQAKKAIDAGKNMTPEQKELWTKFDELAKSIAELTKQKGVLMRPAYDVAYGVVEGKPADAHIQLRGDPAKPGPPVQRGFLTLLGGQRLPPDCKGSGRLELANWITDPANPLTARVIVNRIWQHHFGRGIVATPSDFGTRGAPPSHPELLDWLALRFVEPATAGEPGCGWSIKALHRKIMLSAVYQMSGDLPPAAREADTEDVLLSRYPRRRLEAEAVRDAMLAIAGTLDRSVGGEHPFPAVETWGFSIHRPFYAVYESNRRSVYLMVQRQKRHPYLALFDGADPNVSTDLRVTTITPPQALFLMNSPFVHEQSAALAKRLLSEATDDKDRIRLACELIWGREPDEDDVARAESFLRATARSLRRIAQSRPEQESGAWAAYARVLLTSNGFLYVD